MSTPTPLVAYVLLTEGGEVLASRNPQETFYAASTVKLGVLVEVLRRVDSGDLDLADQLVSKHTFPSGVSGAGEFDFDPDEVDAGMPAAGETMSLEQTLHRMVVFSSNEATNMLVPLVGFEAINRTFESLGAADTKMQRLIGDLAARDSGLSHQTTAADLAVIMRKIAQGQAAGEKSTALMMRLLAEQHYPVIADSLHPQTVWGSKSGWVDYIHHDVAYIGTPGQDRLFLAVCTRGFRVDAAKEIIRAVASQLPHLADR